MSLWLAELRSKRISSCMLPVEGAYLTGSSLGESDSSETGAGPYQAAGGVPLQRFHTAYMPG